MRPCIKVRFAVGEGSRRAVPKGASDDSDDGSKEAPLTHGRRTAGARQAHGRRTAGARRTSLLGLDGIQYAEFREGPDASGTPMLDHVKFGVSDESRSAGRWQQGQQCPASALPCEPLRELTSGVRHWPRRAQHRSGLPSTRGQKG
ncbi:hypothetical protein Rmet_5006 (plasmid) [Cupriavidus metallidurans CH34]|uniref:Uncharacterized protein n=1 Tax=Cupriavidus metallidurans (strain ATCC 43123 / DSM 2839 / NBRC 102507 / CH34) TaxID=266264 RepID=Q1LDA8_CUPMC|nr:hypothetical protein Rmet_5006 [Cupriavidus metallidurans CH34]